MPSGTNRTVLMIGAGPIVIGQSGECDQAAADACRYLKTKGWRIVSVDANPDAIMNAPGWADRTYVEPLTGDTLEQIIKQEQPQAVLSLFGGRTGLDLCAHLIEKGYFRDKGPALWGTQARSLPGLLDRDALHAVLSGIGLKTPPLFHIRKEQDAFEKAKTLGYPVVLRCDDADLIPDGVLAYNQEELGTIAAPILSESSCRLIIEDSLWKWRQAELELLRDRQGTTKLAGMVEYLDAAGIHPGDSPAVSPAQSLSPRLVRMMLAQAEQIAGHLDIVGNVTLRFAYAPDDESLLVLAVHPRYTRTTALVGHATGISMAETICRLAAGETWQDLSSDFAAVGETILPPRCVAVKWPVWDFKKLEEVEDRLGPRMQSIGQSLGIGCCFKEAFLKAARSACSDNFGFLRENGNPNDTLENLQARAASPNSQRVHALYALILRGLCAEELSKLANIDRWFIDQLAEIADMDKNLTPSDDSKVTANILYQAKLAGFSNAQLADRTKLSVEQIHELLQRTGYTPTWRRIGGDGRNVGFIYSTYSNDSNPSVFGDDKNDKTVIILGSGPVRIGQGKECHYGVFACARACVALGYRPIIINDTLTSVGNAAAIDAEYCCAPLCGEELLELARACAPLGIVTQFAGPYAAPVLDELDAKRIPRLGTAVATQQLLENKHVFYSRMRDIGIPQPMGIIVRSADEARKGAEAVGFPLLMHPLPRTQNQIAPNVLRIMDAAMLENALISQTVDEHTPLFIEQFLEYAIEAQAEAVSDGKTAFVAGILEHIELAGVNAGDSACVIPPYSISPRHIETITQYTQKIAVALGVQGLINVRFALYRDSVYLLQASCNTTRNLSMITNVCKIPLPETATRLILGQSLNDMNLTPPVLPYFCVGATVFPFNVFTAIDPVLGHQMRATGKVLSFGDSFGMAYFKALQAAGTTLPLDGTVLITVTDEDKPSIIEPARLFHELGFALMATRGTQSALAEHGIQVQLVRKLGFGRPNLVDEIKNGHVQMVINTPSGGRSQIDDSYIRKAAIHCKIANITTPASAFAAAKGIYARLKTNTAPPRPLQEIKVMHPAV